jgi:hypothetical protein
MKLHAKITRSLFIQILHDLARPHPFALERVVFVSFRPADLRDGILLLANNLHTIRDDDYERNDNVGAMLGSGAFRMALQFAYNNPVSMFHIHKHDHSGIPRDSLVDRESSVQFVPDFWKVRPRFPHGTIILSKDSMSGLTWLPNMRRPIPISRFTIVGTPIIEVYDGKHSIAAAEFSRPRQ